MCLSTLVLGCFILNSVVAVEDFWVVWGQRAMDRCMEIHKNSEQCEVMSDTIEDQMMQTVYPLMGKLKKSNEELVKTSLRVPYILVGQRVVDKYLHILSVERKVSEEEMSRRMFWEVTTFIMDCFYGKEPPVWKKVKEDPFWRQKEANEYLRRLGIDLDKVQTEEVKEDTKTDSEERDEDDWSEYGQFKREL